MATTNKRKIFPDPRQTLEDGIVAVGGDLSIQMLTEAYQNGIFPWPHDGYPLLWFCPKERGILDFKDFHIPRSLSKDLKKKKWQLQINQNFPKVIKACQQQKRKGQDGTWITQQMLSAYLEFYKAGYIKCFECYEGDELIGGLYGVEMNNCFSAESMFFTKTNASKFCFIKMVEHYKSQGFDWIDIQMVTPLTKSFGGKYISRDHFLDRLEI